MFCCETRSSLISKKKKKGKTENQKEKPNDFIPVEVECA